MDKYNTFSGRFFAGIIDSLVLLPLGFLDFYFLRPDSNLSLVLFWIPISYSAYFIYSIYFHWKTGQTIGKKVMKVKVIDVSEDKSLTLKQAFLRDSVYIVLQIAGIILICSNIIRLGSFSITGIEPYNSYLSLLSLAWFLIEIITMFTNDKRRAFHDLIANTVVINSK